MVWANTPVQEGLLGRSDLPLRTAVGAPIYSLGRELCVLILFSPSVVEVGMAGCGVMCHCLLREAVVGLSSLSPESWRLRGGQPPLPRRALVG